MTPIEFDDTRCSFVDHRGAGPDLHPAAQDHRLSLHHRVPVAGLLAQAHPHAAQARGLRPHRRSRLHRPRRPQPAEPRRLRLRAHLLGRRARHRRGRDQTGQAGTRSRRHPQHAEFPPHVGQHRLPAQHVLPLHEPGGLHLRRAQPRLLGRLALGRHAHVGPEPPLGPARAVRPAGGRAQALRDDRVLVGRPRGHLRRHLRRVREHAPAAVAQGSRGENGRYRSLLQPHRRPGGRQVVRSPPGHRRGAGAGHRATCG